MKVSKNREGRSLNDMFGMCNLIRKLTRSRKVPYLVKDVFKTNQLSVQSGIKQMMNDMGPIGEGGMLL